MQAYIRPLRSLVAVALAAVLAGGATVASAQQRRLPFSAGELANYQVKLAGASVGQGTLQVVGMVNIRGEQTFHTRMTVNGRVALARVEDVYESWIDPDGLFSRRFHQNIHEVRYRRNRTYDFFPENRTYRRENGRTGSIPTAQPLDDLSFLYYARTLPLEIGATYTLPRYFKAEGNPVVLRVVRRETVEVPAGRFRTIVIQPVIRTDGLFGEGGRAEVFLSDDEHRIPVLIRSRVPVVGSLTMLLRSYRPGT
ncbi:MAG TPA: DUF3108 domain-containing protein [Longimicrobium sp.]|jgi:hypothetical protein|uniref:DUF3108 domain-containing protein n=1 Tax=Longimicrobium sp. TaxID=2029185 RepID=UPI002ED9C551